MAGIFGNCTQRETDRDRQREICRNSLDTDSDSKLQQQSRDEKRRESVTIEVTFNRKLDKLGSVLDAKGELSRLGNAARRYRFPVTHGYPCVDTAAVGSAAILSRTNARARFHTPPIRPQLVFSPSARALRACARRQEEEERRGPLRINCRN